jgi:dipeptidyl aminopeptidase/acylaminoacyl peptidase
MLTPDGKSILVRATKEDPSRMDLYAVDLASGDMRRMTKQVGNYEPIVPSHNGRRYAAVFRSWNQFREMVVDEKTVTSSHRSEDFFKVVRHKPELFTYQNRNGQTIHGYMFLPPDWKKEDKRPLMIYVYGGPLGEGKSVVDGDFNTTAYQFNLYLSRVLGYVTVTIDPRGSSGYGAAFGKANWEQVGTPQTQDLEDGVKHLVANYGVDPKRVAVNGWSFGGFQTMHCLFNAPDTFTLGIAGAGPTQWQNYNTWYTGGVIGNSPKGDGNFLDKFSLTHVAKNLRSPLLLLHGVEDTNVLYQDTMFVYRSLLQAGKGTLVELSVDPTGGHGMGGDMSNRDRHAIYLAFLLKHWGYPAAP